MGIRRPTDATVSGLPQKKELSFGSSKGREFSDASRFAFRCVRAVRHSDSPGGLDIRRTPWHWNGEKQNDEAEPSFRASNGPGTRPRCSRTEATSHFVDDKNATMVGGAVGQKNTPPLCPRFTTMRKTNQKAFDEVRNSHSTPCEFAIRWLTQLGLKRQCFNGWSFCSIALDFPSDNQNRTGQKSIRSMRIQMLHWSCRRHQRRSSKTMSSIHPTMTSSPNATRN